MKHQTQMSLALVGVGAIGSVIGALLHETREVTTSYFNRSERTAIHLFGPDGIIDFPISARSAHLEEQKFDWVVTCLKEHQFLQAKNLLEQLIHSWSKVLVIRNGIRHKESLSGIAAPENILECVIDCPTQPSGNGYKYFKKPGLLFPEGGLAREFAKLLPDEKVQIALSQDFKTASWKKLIESAALGAVLCVARDTCRVFEEQRWKDMFIKLLTEGIAVAQADGAFIQKEFVSECLEKLDQYPPEKGSSMLTDLLNGAPIEWGAKNGMILIRARENGIATPLNDQIVNQFTNGKFRVG